MKEEKSELVEAIERAFGARESSKSMAFLEGIAVALGGQPKFGSAGPGDSIAAAIRDHAEAVRELAEALRERKT